MDLKLADRNALVTGGWRGTGAGTARMLAQEGMHVWVHGFETGQPDEVVESIVAAGGSAEGVVADIAGDEGVASLTEVLNRVDVLVNNYGTPVGSTWTSMDDWAEEWNRNVLVGVRLAQRCLPAMRDRGWGRVIFIGTVGAHRPGARNPGYYAAKAGLHTLVRALAKEVRGSGVTANVVSPGMIATAEVRSMLTRRATRHDVDPDWKAVERWAVANSMPNLTDRLPEPEDIGRIVAMVASDAAWHMNGAEIAVDGGALDA